MRDAKEWLFIYRRLNEVKEYVGISFEAKLFINLLFSMECSFKSIIMSLSKSQETAEKAYGVARNCNHNLTKLFKECKKRSGGRCKICSKDFIPELEKIDRSGIDMRYDIDLKIAYKHQSFSELFIDGPISSVVIDPSFHNKMLIEASELCKRASYIYSIRFKKHTLISLSDSGKIDQYIGTKIINK